MYHLGDLVMKYNIVSLSLFKYMMKPDRVLQMIRLNQPPIVGINSTATEFIFYKLSVTTSNYIELFVLEIELKFHNLFR